MARFAKPVTAILVRSLIGLLIFAAVLVAIYLLAVKPILDTTNDALDQFGGVTNGITDEIQQALDDAGVEGFDIGDLSGDGESRSAQKLLDCIERVEPNAKRMQACVRRSRN